MSIMGEFDCTVLRQAVEEKKQTKKNSLYGNISQYEATSPLLSDMITMF